MISRHALLLALASAPSAPPRAPDNTTGGAMDAEAMRSIPVDLTPTIELPPPDLSAWTEGAPRRDRRARRDPRGRMERREYGRRGLS